ncbi:hypothetical protein BDV06DRAFT_219229 [Aspergillus oleicola]
MPSILLLLIALASFATAKIVETAVASPYDQYDIAPCLPPFDERVSITTTAFKSNYSDSLLLYAESFEMNTGYMRDANRVFFGYAPSNSSITNPPFRACSLFLNDPSPWIRVNPEEGNSYYNRTKNFPERCVADLTEHYDRAAREANIRSDAEVLRFCRRQKTSLENYNPDSCAGYTLKVWDYEAITANSTKPANCTLGGMEHYAIHQMTGLSSTHPEQVLNMTWPVITMMFPVSGLNDTVIQPETHYDTLRSGEDLMFLVEGSGPMIVIPPAIHLVLMSWVAGAFLLW